jgi:hypothetical protein
MPIGSIYSREKVVCGQLGAFIPIENWNFHHPEMAIDSSECSFIGTTSDDIFNDGFILNPDATTTAVLLNHKFGTSESERVEEKSALRSKVYSVTWLSRNTANVATKEQVYVNREIGEIIHHDATYKNVFVKLHKDLELPKEESAPYVTKTQFIIGGQRAYKSFSFGVSYFIQDHHPSLEDVWENIAIKKEDLTPDKYEQESVYVSCVPLGIRQRHRIVQGS